MRLARILSWQTLAPMAVVSIVLIAAVVGLAAMLSNQHAQRARLGLLEGALLGEEHTALAVLDLLDQHITQGVDPAEVLSTFTETRSSDLALFTHEGLALSTHDQAQTLSLMLGQMDLQAARDDWRLNDRRRFSLDNINAVLDGRDDVALSATFLWIKHPPRLIGYGRTLAVSQARAEDLGRSRFMLAVISMLAVVLGGGALIGVVIAATHRRLQRLVLKPMAEVEASLANGADLDAVPIPVNAADEFRTLATGYNRQLAEIRTAQRAAEERERDLDAVFRAMPGAVLVLDDECRVQRINPGASSLLGISSSDAIGQRLRDVAELRDPLDHRRIDLKPTTSREVSLLRPDGMRLAVAIYLVERSDGAGGSVAVLQDLSEIRAVARQVRQAARFEATDQLVAGGIHDINNALAIVLAGHDLLRKYCVEPAQRKYLSAATTGTERAISTLKRLQDFVRRGPAKLSDITVPQLLERAHRMLSPGLPQTVTFMLDIVASTPAIRGDADALLDAITNLVLNARDALGESGTITLRCDTSQVERTQAQRLGIQPGTYATIAVSDTGVGIPPEIQDKLFSTYFTTKPVGKGNGLGLVSCLGIARQHQGTIAVESQPSRGTTFTIYLSANGDTGEVLATRRTSTPMRGLRTPGTTGPLLLVDDDPLLREGYRAWFTEAGFAVDVAQNGEDALTRIGEREPLAIVADLDMPRMDGQQLIERCCERWPDLPCVLLTGAPDRPGLAAWALEHFVTLVAKPMLMADLEHLVRHLVQESDRLNASS